MANLPSNPRTLMDGTTRPLQGDSTILLGSTPILRENILEVIKGLPPLFSFPNLTRGLAAKRLFKVPPCHKSTVHLQTSMPSSGFEPRPYGMAVSFTNHYTGWAASRNVKYPICDENFSIVIFMNKVRYTYKLQ
ncbi:hypothetical protein TNCV_1293491 [Trichonephila clavipes]|nr:hypothetical protein TNCV_1293491 [Trichonephila clavipes]